MEVLWNTSLPDYHTSPNPLAPVADDDGSAESPTPRDVIEKVDHNSVTKVQDELV
jgi:hypothetical protein